jgi:hypothetical protein
MNESRSAGAEGSSRALTLPLSLPRKVVCDLLHFAHRIPTVPVQRTIQVGELRRARRHLCRRPGWCALFTKAYALVARDFPELRRAYLSYPVPRLYQHPVSIASVAVEREYQGEHGVFFGYLPNPESLRLEEVDAALRTFQQSPVPEVFGFTLRFYRLPCLLRRLAWWYILNVRGARKAQFLGTFGVSVYSHLGAESLHPLSPLTTTLNYGVIGEDGAVTVRVVYDHRVLDGATVARALARLEEVLNQEVLREVLAATCAPVT